MANNPALFNAALTGAAGGMQTRWNVSTVQGDYLSNREVAAAFATAVDGAIAPISGGASDGQVQLLESLCFGAFSGRFPLTRDVADYTSLAEAIAANYLQVSASLLPSSSSLASLGIYSITEFGAVAGQGVSTERQAANVVAIQAAIDFCMSSGAAFGEGATLIVPPGVYEINAAIGIRATADRIAGICFKGIGGRYTSVLKQINASLNVLEVTDTTINIRCVEVRDMTLTGGKYGLYLKNAIYNIFVNVTLHANTTYGIYGDVNVYANFDDCWFSDIVTGNCFISQSGIWFMNHCWFGEASGGLDIVGGTVHLDNCYLFDCADNLNHDTFGNGHPCFYVASGGQLYVNGGEYIFRASNCSMAIYGFVAGTIAIEGGVWQCPSNITRFLVEYLANAYDQVFNCRPGMVQADYTGGFNMYVELTSGPPDPTHARSKSVIDTSVSYRTLPPTVGSMWIDPGQNNQTQLRPRLVLV